MEECRTSIHVTLEDLFLYDPNSPQNYEGDDTEQFALITKIKVDDRTNNKALFEFAIVKDEDGQGILTLFDSASTTTLILRDLVRRKALHVKLKGTYRWIN